ncbi:MAG: CoA-binding protein [Desulfobacterales bacterium]
MPRNDLERMFAPKSVAVVGAKQIDPTLPYLGMFGAIQQCGYKGRLYPINRNLPAVNGVKAYPNLMSLPEPVDLVIISVPAPAVPDVLNDCVASGNKNIHIFTAGFKETGEPDGLRFQKEIEEIAVSNDLRVIGPNCMGICVPELRLATWNNPVDVTGPVSFVSQSGGHAQDFSNYAADLGIGFSKIVSFGNALTLDSTDFLNYLAQDPKTEIIAMYLEGVKDGRKLMDQIKRINPVKPVVIIKGGLTKSGTHAVASHTGSMAGEEQFWRAFFRQTGAIRAHSLEDMAHTILALLRLDRTQGKGVCVFGSGGGVVVAISDACSRIGLDLPPFSSEMQQSLRKFIPEAGNMIKNPLDAHQIILEADKYLAKTLDLIHRAPDIHMVIISLHTDWMGPQLMPKVVSAIKTIVPAHLKEKPFVVCWRQTRRDQETRLAAMRLEKELSESGIPVYRSFEDAALALARFSDYHLYYAGGGESGTEKIRMAS